MTEVQPGAISSWPAYDICATNSYERTREGLDVAHAPELCFALCRSGALGQVEQGMVERSFLICRSAFFTSEQLDICYEFWRTALCLFTPEEDSPGRGDEVQLGAGWYIVISPLIGDLYKVVRVRGPLGEVAGDPDVEWYADVPPYHKDRFPLEVALRSMFTDGERMDILDRLSTSGLRHAPIRHPDKWLGEYPQWREAVERRRRALGAII